MYTENSRPTGANITKKIIGGIVLLLAIVVIITSGMPMMTRASVEAQLQRFAAYLADRSQNANGVQAHFAYDGVAMQGLAFNIGTSAVVQNPSLAFQRGAGPGSDTVTFSTDQVKIIPHNTAASHITIQFPDPLRIADNGAHVTSVIFDGVPSYDFKQRVRDKETEQWLALSLPPKFTIQPETADGRPAEGRAKVIVTYNPNPVFTVRLMPATGASTSELHVQNLSMTEESGKGTITAGSVDASTNKGVQGDGKQNFGAVISLQDLGVQAQGVLEGPYHFKLDASGTRAAPVSGQPMQEADVALRELNFGSDKFSVAAAGTISTRTDDLLPFGEIDVTTRNFAALRDGPTLSPDNKALLVETVSKITGEDANAAAELHFAIKREKQGTLTIGNASFEEVAALVFSRTVLRSQTPPATAVTAPAAAVPVAPVPPAPVNPAPEKAQ